MGSCSLVTLKSDSENHKASTLILSQLKIVAYSSLPLSLTICGRLAWLPQESGYHTLNISENRGAKRLKLA